MKVLQISVGKDFTLMLVNSGRVYSWGSNKRSQLGYKYPPQTTQGGIPAGSGSGSSSAGSLAPPTTQSNTCPLPRLVDSPHNRNIKQIACGVAHAAMLSETGTLYVWGAGYALGRNRDEQLRGDGSTKRSKHTHEHIYGELMGTHQQQQGDLAARVMSEAWTNEDCVEPTSLPFFVKRRIQAITSGDVHLVVKSGVELLSWGLNSSGQLGDGTTVNRQFPTPVKLPASSRSEAAMDALSLVCAGKHVGVVHNGEM
jgi:alpha-tubulin suppressor-like RCC1 family protein